MKKNNTYTLKIILALNIVFSTLIGLKSLSAQTIQVGDLLTFSDGTKGIVCYVDKNQDGWVIDLNDMDGTYKLYDGSSLPASSTIPFNSGFNNFTLSSWGKEGKNNTEALSETENSPAAQAVGIENGWYIPDVEQMSKIAGLYTVLKSAFARADEGSIDELFEYGRHYWTSSRYNTSYFYRLYNNSSTYGAQMSYASPSNSYHIRRVRDFSHDYNLKAYWMSDTTKTTIRVSPDITTEYTAMIVYNADTFSVRSSVIVHFDINVDTLHTALVYKGQPFDTVIHNKSFRITGPGMYLKNDTVTTSTACDDVFAIMVDVADYDVICASDLASYKWKGLYPLPDNTNSDGFYEFKGKKDVGGTLVDTVAYLKLDITPVYISYDVLEYCLYQNSLNEIYSKNSNVTITENTVTSSSSNVVITPGENSGDYVLTMKTTAGCDSIIHLHVDVNHVPRDTVYADTLYIDESFTYQMGRCEFTVAGKGLMTANDTLVAKSGCDSVVVYMLIVETPHYDTICESELASYKWKDIYTIPHEVDAQGFHRFSGTKTINGKSIDTISYLKLTINPEFFARDTVKLCMYKNTISTEYDKNPNVTITENAVTSSSPNVVITPGVNTGDYILSMQTKHDCDSIIYLHVSRNLVPRDTLRGDTLLLEDIVDGETVVKGYTFKNITTPGTYLLSDTLNAKSDCDSIVTVVLVVNLGCKMEVNLKSTIDETCGGDGAIEVSTVLGEAPLRFTLDGQTWQTDSVFENIAAGSYSVVAEDAKGCRDTVPAMVVVKPDATITVTCMQNVYDTLAYGDCVMNVYPDKIGTPTVEHTLDWPVTISNNIPEEYLFQEGETVITWIATDKCGNSESCEQKVYIAFPQCPDAVDCEGNVYKSVRIGCDCWTQRNLESTKYSAGNQCAGDIPCTYEYATSLNPDVVNNVAVFGRLYCFDAAIGNGVVNDYGHIQGICPSGWYLPTSEKYSDLYSLGDNALKSQDYWIDGAGENTTGFTWLPAGFWNGEMNRFEGLYSNGFFWSTEDTDEQIVPKVFHVRYACDHVLFESALSGNAYSVRCIKEKE